MRSYLEAIEAASAKWRGLVAPLPPIVLAALRPLMQTLARDKAAGAFSYFVTDEHTRKTRALLGDEPFLTTDLPVVLETDPARARAIGDKHTTRYLATENYRKSLLAQGFTEADLEGAGSQKLFDAIVAWGTPSTIADRVRARLAAGADHVIVNIAHENLRQPYLEELRALAPAVVGL